MEQCLKHSGLEERLKNVEGDTDAQWKSIDKMKAWVIAGSGSMILCLIGIIIQLILQR